MNYRRVLKCQYTTNNGKTKFKAPDANLEASIIFKKTDAYRLQLFHISKDYLKTDVIELKVKEMANFVIKDTKII